MAWNKTILTNFVCFLTTQQKMMHNLFTVKILLNIPILKPVAIYRKFSFVPKPFDDALKWKHRDIAENSVTLHLLGIK